MHGKWGNAVALEPGEPTQQDQPRGVYTLLLVPVGDLTKSLARHRHKPTVVRPCSRPNVRVHTIGELNWTPSQESEDDNLGI